MPKPNVYWRMKTAGTDLISFGSPARDAVLTKLRGSLAKLSNAMMTRLRRDFGYRLDQKEKKVVKITTLKRI
jgi:hypothetical protein